MNCMGVRSCGIVCPAYRFCCNNFQLRVFILFQQQSYKLQYACYKEREMLSTPLYQLVENLHRNLNIAMIYILVEPQNKTQTQVYSWPSLHLLSSQERVLPLVVFVA